MGRQFATIGPESGEESRPPARALLGGEEVLLGFPGHIVRERREASDDPKKKEGRETNQPLIYTSKETLTTQF